MERAVPNIVSEEIELYLRTYYSLLRSSTEVKIRSLTEVHAGMNSLLHPDARHENPDMSAFIYSVLRLPEQLPHIKLVILGQSYEMFEKMGYPDLNKWQSVTARARRRRTFYNGKETLAFLIASRSDIDDLVPMLTAFQIEWNKLHHLMKKLPENVDYTSALENEANKKYFADNLLISIEDLERLATIWGKSFGEYLKLIQQDHFNLKIKLLSGSLMEYRRAINAWWHRIDAAEPTLKDRPVYFVSSNAHSLVNMVTGFALEREDELVQFLKKTDDALLKQEWADIERQLVPSSRENFFYYILKNALQSPSGLALAEQLQAAEHAQKVRRITSAENFDIEAQIIPVASLGKTSLDPRLQTDELHLLQKSDALILNIDYPLGLAAYQVLTEISDHVGQVLGIYIMGKAATLNGAVGDVMVPNVVYDGHSRNTYIFNNCFHAADLTPYLEYGTVLDGQKAVTLWGTFLQNQHYMEVFYREGYTDIEMEAGPYLSAAYEMFRPKRHPIDEIVNLYDLPFDLGILHYASDKPISKGKNLGAASPSYYAMDPTYATSVAVLKRIMTLEKKRLAGRN